MAQDRSDLLQSTFDLLILMVLSLEPMHGWGIAQKQLAKERADWERSSSAVNWILEWTGGTA